VYGDRCLSELKRVNNYIFKITFNVLTYTQQIQKLVRMTKGCGISNKIPNIQTGKIQSIIKLNVPLNSYISTYEILTTYEMFHTGVSGAGRGTPDYRGSTELLLVGVTDCFPTAQRLKSQALLEVCSEQVHCANPFRIGSSKSPFTMKFCTCSLTEFLDFLLVCRQLVVLIFCTILI